jgi:secreted trypsin-like serine protease
MPVRNPAPCIGQAACWLAMIACGPDGDLISETSAPIIGGHSAPHADYGWFASLWDHNGLGPDARYCGGSLIAPAWVLTAAHCAVFGVDFVEIGPTDSTERQVIGIFSHPTMDIALLHLSSSSSAEPVALNLDPGFPAAISIFLATAADANLTTAGFGSTTASDDPSDDLLEVDVPALTNDSCEDVYPDGLFEGIEIDESDLCVGTYAGGDVPCHGDSGGPLFAWTGAGQTLVGVTNTSNPICALPLRPAVFGRVSAAAGWIAGIASGVRFVSPAALIGVATPIVI